MKKMIAMTAALVMTVSLFTACGDSASSEPAVSEPASSAVSSEAAPAETSGDLAADLEKLVAVNAVANPLELDEFALEFDMGLTMDNVAEFAGVRSNDNGNSATNLVIRTAEGKASDVIAELETYQQSLAEVFAGYEDDFGDGLEQINNGRIETSGDYVVLVFANTEGASYADIDAAIEELLK